MKKQIICIGIYRSGTSLVSGTIAKLGIDVGNHMNLTHPTKNPMGFWECEDCLNVCVALRKIAGERQFFDVDKTDIDKVINDDSANKLVKDYIDKRNIKDVWAVKDPKMLPFYFLFEKYLTDPYLIFIKRNKDSVIKSWKSVKPSMAGYVDRAYENHLEMYNIIKKHAEEKGIPWIEIDYSDHIDNPKETAKKIADFIGVESNPQAVDFCQHYSLSGKK